MTELGIAFGLMFIIEGIFYALFPDHMRRMIVSILELPTDKIRAFGVSFAIFGLIIVYLVGGH